jgi:hypothetical protein
MVIVLIAGAALGFLAWRVAAPSSGRPVTKAQIEQAVAKRPARGHVRLVLCNEEFISSEQPQSDPPQTWTCDTYLGSSIAGQQNGPSYRVTVRDDRIRSIRQVPVH